MQQSWMVILLLCLPDFSGTNVLTTQSGVLEPPVFSPPPTWPNQAYYDEDGPPIQLRCRLLSSSGVTLLWYRNETLLGNSDFYDLGNRNMTLTLLMPKTDQSGEYECLAYNAAGNVSHTGYILIAGRQQENRPRVVDYSPASSVLHVAVGATVNISCMFDVGGSQQALMDLQLDWRKGNTSVEDGNHTVWGLETTDSYNQVLALTIYNLTTDDYGDYVCYGENSQGNDTQSISVQPPQPRHKSLPLALIVGCGAAALFVLVVAPLAVLIVRYRTRTKYEQLEWPEPDDSYQVPERKLEYDVFISYSSEDFTWVKEVLLDNLHTAGYHVCIDFKDFVPGMPVAENIMDAIYKSRKTIVLMSNNFLKSMWGQFELQQALNRAVVQRQDCLIIIKHDDSKVPVKLAGRTFLDWTDTEVRPHFWTRLHDAIGKPGELIGLDRDADVAKYSDGETNKDNAVNIEAGNLTTMDEQIIGVIQNISLRDETVTDDDGEVPDSVENGPTIDKEFTQNQELTENYINNRQMKMNRGDTEADMDEDFKAVRGEEGNCVNGVNEAIIVKNGRNQQVIAQGIANGGYIV